MKVKARDIVVIFDTLRDQRDEARTERDALRTAITEMAERYRAHEGRFGGTGVAGELDAILNVAPAAEEYTDDDAKYLTTFGGMKWYDDK